MMAITVAGAISTAPTRMAMMVEIKTKAARNSISAGKRLSVRLVLG
jgi:hypothetical protein